MNLAEVSTLDRLFRLRGEIINRLASLKNDPREVIEVQVVLSGVSQRLKLDKPFIATQWTAEFLDVERRIRRLGGTI